MMKIIEKNSMKRKVCFLVLIFLFSTGVIFGTSLDAGISFSSSDVSVERNSKFQVELEVYTYVDTVAATEVMITYDPELLKLDSDFYDLESSDSLSNERLSLQDKDDLAKYISLRKPGELIINYFDINGFGPGQGFNFFTLHLESLDVVKETSIQATIQSMINVNAESVLYLSEAYVSISIVSPFSPCANSLGDVNGDGKINIIDAFLICNYPYGTWRTNFQICAADVDQNGSVNIVDALLIARYYVGYITEFPKP